MAYAASDFFDDVIEAAVSARILTEDSYTAESEGGRPLMDAATKICDALYDYAVMRRAVRELIEKTHKGGLDLVEAVHRGALSTEELQQLAQSVKAKSAVL